MKIEYFGTSKEEPEYSSVQTGTLEELLKKADISQREFMKMAETGLSKGTKILVLYDEEEPEALITLEESCRVRAPDFGSGLSSDQYLIIVEDKTRDAAIVFNEPMDITDGDYIRYEGETHDADHILLHS